MRLLVLFLALAGIAFGLTSCDDASSPEPMGQDEDENSDEEDDDSADESTARRDSSTSSGDARPTSNRDAGASDAAAARDGTRPTPDTGDARPADSGRPTGDAGSASPDTGSSEEDRGSAGYSPCPSDGEPCKILPLGDSITFGMGDGMSFLNPGGYRSELFELALADNHNITFVGSQQNGPDQVNGMSFPGNHEGYSGWTIDQIAGLVPMPAFDDDPDIVLLMAGTNDMYRAGAQGAAMRLERLIDKIVETDPDVLLVVAQITPLPSSEANVQAFNQAIPAIVESRQSAGKHVLVVDMNTDFPVSELADRVHPNADGYGRMAGIWYQAIEPVLN